MAKPVYDALIIGGGPAGLTVALGMGRVVRTAMVFDSQQYRNAGIGAMHMVPSRDGINPSDFRQLSREETVAKYGDHIHFAEPGTNITKVTKASVAVSDAPSGECDGFEVSDEHGKTWRGRKLVLATGSRDIMPPTPGFAECWPTNIHHCLFCDGFEQRKHPIGLYGFKSPQHHLYAFMASKFNPNITIFTDGPAPTDPAIADSLETAKARGVKVETRKIAKLSKEYIGPQLPEALHDEANTIMRIDFETGEPAHVGFMLAHPETETRSADLATQLGLDLLSADKMGKGEIETHGFFNEASVPGVYVAGDCQTPMKNATEAIDSGAKVSAGIAHALAREEGQWARQAAGV